MLFSIVTPSFNHVKFIDRTIRSVLDQRGVDFEYIVIDGGSTDGTADIIRRYESRLTYWVTEPDRGQTDAINKGFSMAKGDILAWINSDDTYEPGAFAAAAAYFAEHPGTGLLYGDANFINGDDEVIGKFPAAKTDYRRLRQGYVHVPQQAAFFRADLWRKIGPLDPSFYFAMDYDLWVRLARLAPVVYLPGLWANFRLHGDAKTITADDRCWPEMLKVHRREGGSVFSVIYAKYLLRKLAAPYINLRRRRMFER